MEPNRLTGTIKSIWSKGSGLIQPTDNSPWVWFDLKDIQTEHTGVGAKVSYMAVPSPGRKKLRAVDIRRA